LYWQRQCFFFTARPDKVVYDEDPAAAAGLLQAGSEYGPYAPSNGPAQWRQHRPTQTAVAFCPHCLQMLCGTTSARIRDWAIFPHAGNPAVVFLHERISPAGHRRLVCISYAPEGGMFNPAFIEGFDYSPGVVTPATWTAPPHLATDAIFFDVRGVYSRHPPMVRIFAGQADPLDPAHFTIRYQMWGQDDVLDGRLQDDDQIVLTPRHLPWPKPNGP
jgi:hypothetical protein